jgi:hypothetical protein
MGRVMKRISAIGGGTGIELAAWWQAGAADLASSLPVKGPVRSAIYDWTGFYLGGQFGYGGGSFGPDTNPLPERRVFFPHSVTGLIGGYQAGYNRQLANHLVLGVEADASFSSPLDAPALTPAPFLTTLDYVGTVRGRVGYAFGTWMPYLTGGFAWGHTHININDDTPSVVASVDLELEERYAIVRHPGKLRLGAFATSGNTGNYRQALAIEAADPGVDISDAMVSIRHNNLKYGFYVNAEQEIAKDVGLFARASWNDGHNEILSFTDIDRSLSGGLSIKGS